MVLQCTSGVAEYIPTWPLLYLLHEGVCVIHLCNILRRGHEPPVEQLLFSARAFHIHYIDYCFVHGYIVDLLYCTLPLELASETYNWNNILCHLLICDHQIQHFFGIWQGSTFNIFKRYPTCGILGLQRCDQFISQMVVMFTKWSGNWKCVTLTLVL